MVNDLPSKLIEAGIPYVSSGKNVGQNDLNIKCPYCAWDDPSEHCGINTTTGKFYCFRCGEGGGWRKLGKKLEIRLDDVYGDDGFDIPLAKKLDPVDKEKVFYKEPNEKHMKMFKYLLEDRQLDLDRCFDAGLKKGINTFKGYAVFFDGEIAIGRNYLDNGNIKWRKPRGHTGRLFGGSFVNQRDPEIGVIVEGVFDMLRFPIGTAAALLCKKISDSIANQILLSFRPSCKKIVLATDRDLTSRERFRLVRQIRGLGFEVILPNWDLAPAGVKDIDDFFVSKGEKEMYEFLGISKPEEPKFI